MKNWQELLKWWFTPVKNRIITFLSLLSRGDFLRAGNFFLAHLNMARRPLSVGHYPLTLVIDPGNVCNLACAWCITGQKKSKRSPAFLSLLEFKKIIDRLGKYACQVDLYNWGEPFLNKDIFAMIAYAKRAGLRVETSSNLHLLTPARAKQVVTSGLDRLIVSLHGTNQKVTETYMRGSKFSQVIKNLKLLLQIRKKQKSLTPSITWRYVVSRYNEEGLRAARKMAKRLGVDYFEPIPLMIEAGSAPGQMRKSLRTYRHWLAKNPAFNQERLLAKPGRDCYWPWEIIAINPDGGIQPCCSFSDPAFDFGNIFTTPFEKIWNGLKYQTARRLVREKIKTDTSLICGLCLGAGFIGK